VRRITTSELETLIKEGRAYVVDVRSQDSYDMGHIPGSRLIPANDIVKHIDQLPRDKMIVTYCS
jgi:ArsR family transcriptional regulator